MNTQAALVVQIEGMSCASCVGRVEKALLAVAGVDEAVVNLANETATVSYNNALDLEELKQALTEVGYPAVVESTTLEIQGMNCASCVGRLEKALVAGRGGGGGIGKPRRRDSPGALFERCNQRC